MTSRRFCLALAFLWSACAGTEAVRKEDMLEAGIVFPIGMCAQHGTVVRSNDDPGKELYCEQVEPTGSHLPQCICWDQQMVTAKREAAQQAMREYQ